MSTGAIVEGIASALFGKTRRLVLGLLYGHPDEAFYVRQIIRATRTSPGATHRELQRLAGAGIIQRVERGRQVYYQANADCPVFAELRGLLTKTAGIGDVVRAALVPLASGIDVAFLYGSMARGEPRRTSDVDLLIVGEVSFADIVAALADTQEQLGREINPTVYPRAEFRHRLAAEHHFVRSVVNGSKVFLIGDDRDLAGLAAQRLAHRASAKPAGDRRPRRSGRSRS